MAAQATPRLGILEPPTGPLSASLWRIFFRNKLCAIGFVMLVSMLIIAIFAPWIAPFDPYEIAEVTINDVLAPPSSDHLLGQDDVGEDVLSSVIYGSRISLTVGIAASIIIVMLGTFMGMLAGYFGGLVDMIIMRIVDSIMVIPQLPLMLVIIAVAGRGIVNIILVIGLLTWTFMARLVRAQVMTVKERKFVLRARSIGVGHILLMVRHILPQVLPIIFAEATLGVSYAILSEATLSFLGLGDPTLVSWGSMLNRAFLMGSVTRGAWWFIIPPGFALAWVTLALTFLSNGIQEIVNPRLKSHHLFDESKMVVLKRTRVSPMSMLMKR